MIPALVLAALLGQHPEVAVHHPEMLGSCDAHGVCRPGHVETCRIKAPERSRESIRQFRAKNPCPETGKLDGACPGWEIDHARPLCCGGKDAPENMRWLEHDLHKLRHAGGVDCGGFPKP